MKEFTWDELIQAKPTERRKMWTQLQKDLPGEADYWQDSLACHEGGICEYVSGGWCNYMELPCGVNPYLTPRTGMLGMACMGARPHQILFEQIALFD